ncbi:MAG TPA: bifunctional hydroxymethylpyrimidine kinase/phosphomethylpyrimidine kinase [Acidimicrobiales bacterium]|nr:bifunctional hydroxymethylpyrimidine kinase/phosphomethylpyrimidine kinase [Acidimicrobiales bacterium]
MALTIAGSDSGGGAGLQADLKAFAANGVFGASVVTAVTAQNSRQVSGVVVMEAAFVEAQLDAVLSDLPVAAVKTGMLATAAIVEAVGRRARAGELPNLVVDPVMVASSGDRLLDEDAVDAYRQELFPAALLITPNLREAGLLVGRALDGPEDMEWAARQLAESGPAYVLVKGGHLTGDAVDILYDGRTCRQLSSPRVETANVHGTGCTLAAAIAARLALGCDVPTAVRAAKEFVTDAIRGSADWHLGAGHGPLDHFGWGRRAS